MATAIWEAPRRSDELFAAIGAFLVDNGLGADPSNYDFAYRIVSDPTGPLAQAVESLTEGGLRLTARDIKDLGGTPVAGAAVKAVAATPATDAASALVARTQLQVDQFADVMRAMHAEARGFGRDLRASAEAIRDGHVTLGVEEVIRLTGIMLDRVRHAEAKMDAATRETEELRVQLDEARQHARRDPMTGLPNRRALEEAFASIAARNIPACVAICDVDRFKSVNDRFGHPVGDRVLRAIGEMLTKLCDGHLVARYGGEEFAVLFSGLALADAYLVLDDARERVATKRFKLRETDTPLGAVTFSAGLAEIRAGEPLEDAIRRADLLLYTAKDAGRNHVSYG